MHRLLPLLAVLLLALPVVQPVQARHHSPHAASPVRHYFGGWTRITFYTDCCQTASGAQVFYGEVAADSAIPFGSHVVIPGLGRFVVLDRGGLVYGDHLDVWLPYPGYRAVADYYQHVYWSAP